MRKLLTLLALSLTFLSLASYAQTKTGRISGTVIDGSTKTIESATITLLKAKDSSVVKMAVADKAGKYEFENVPEGRYIVAISAVGHDKGFSAPVEISAASTAVEVKTIELVPQAQAIGGVTVTAKKPAIEMKPGKMVLNVDASPTNAGLTAMELLEKSPGVTVDNDGNISVKGKQGVMILVDGKPTYMSGADLAALLKNMQSNAIDQIEIMTNPPAKYDASGNSGIINIKTKKGIVKGMNGNANAGYTQGLYARFNGGVNLNYRNNKLNVFGGYNAGTYEGYNRLTIDRKLYAADKVTLLRTIDQVSRPHFKGVYHNAKVGMDYYFSKKDVAGIVVNGNFNTNDEDPYSNTNIRDNNGKLMSKLESFADNSRNSSNITTNFNYKHTFDSTGREISTDFDWAYYDNDNKTSLLTRSFNENNQHIPGQDVLMPGIIPSIVKIYSAKVDYVHPFKSGLRLEAGAKTSFVNTDNKVNYQRNGVEAVDRNNHFVYDENINAAYAILSRSIKKWELTAGLRLENTIAKGHQLSNDSSFKRNYTNLFPNIGAGYNMNEKNQFNLSYSRRIMRPDYDALNPFIFFLDSLTYGQGNPYLTPQFTNNFEFSHTYNRFLTTTVNYTQTTDIITELLKQDTEKNITFQTKDNFSTMKQWGVSLMANIPVRKWWNANIYTNVFHNSYKGLYNNDPVEIGFTSFLGNITNAFTLGKGWNAEISGWYRSKAAEGILVARAMGAMNSAITKQMLKGKGTLKFGMRDILWTQKFNGYAKYSDVDVTISSRRDSRQFNMSFTYRFGKKNIAPARRKTGGADDEQNRVKSGGGN
jgi:iron complex outermembrane recepter protein